MNALMTNDILRTIGLYINLTHTFLEENKLDYDGVVSYHACGNNRIVFDIITKQKYTVHVDAIQSQSTVEQLMDCLYGAGSESDHKLIICEGDGNPYEDEPILKQYTPEQYYVCMMAEHCNMIGLPFSVIEYIDCREGIRLLPHFSKRKEYIMDRESRAFNRLPSKWDIQRMAFWALHFSPCLPSKFYFLEDLRCSESMQLKITDQIHIRLKWDDDGITYIISDDKNSAFFFELWMRYIMDHSIYCTPHRSPTFYREGKESRICIPGDGVPISKLNGMSEFDQKMLGVQLYRGARKLRSEVINIWNEHNGSSQPIEENRGTLFSDLDF